MRTLLFLVLVGLLSGTRPIPKEVMDSPPEYFVLEWKEGTRLHHEPTDFFIEIDSFGRQEVFALVDEKKAPILYTADIATPVCADGECKLMNMKFYWTLLGEYAGFDRYPMMPLTKHDHDVFEEEDYQKLHRLLNDDKSPLGRRTIDQLVEKPTMRTVNGVDAISGATITQVKEAVVSGALYSCYTAWHLVHGEIQAQLKANTISVLNKQMLVAMLYSSNDEYQLFALEKFSVPQYQEHYEQIALAFKTSTPLVRSIIAKRLISKYNDAPELQRPFWQAFDKVDSGSRSLLLKAVNNAPNYVFDILSQQLGSMSKNQLKTFLGHLFDKGKMSAEIRNNLLEFANSKNETYSYLVMGFLEESK